MLQKTILCTLLFVYSQILVAQHNIFKEFGINDGLPSLQVYDIYQAKNGIIWYATDRGLASYNGYEFKKYGVQDGVFNNVVLDFYPQKNGDVYCATLDSKLFYFNENFNGFITYPYNHILELEHQFKDIQFITSLYVDDTDNLHLSSDKTIGKLVISKDGNVLETPEANKIDELPTVYLVLGENDSSFAYYARDSRKATPDFLEIQTTFGANNLPIVLPNTQHIVYSYKMTVFIADKTGKVMATIENSKMPLVLKVIDESHFFVGYHFGGGAIVNSQGIIVERFLENKSVTDFFVDTEGGYWFSTLNSGVFYTKEPKIRVFKTQIDAPIKSLTKNAANELYIGYENGAVERIDIHKKSFLEYTSKATTKAFVEYDKIHDELYVNSGATFYKKDKNNKKKYITNYKNDGFTVKLSEPTKEGMMISQIGRVVIVKNDSITYLNTSVRVQDACIRNEEVYLGTHLGAYVFKNEKLISLETLAPVFKNRIEDVDFHKKRGEIYFATLGAGIIIYNAQNEEIRTITTQDGLSSNIINEVYIENENELWVCTNSGLHKVKFLTDGNFEITGLKSSGGLLNDGISDVEVINDTVWIASQKGLIYAPKSLFDTKEKTNVYPLKITAVYVNDVSVCREKLGNLSHKENKIEFFVEGISFKKAGDVLYKYKLEGLDDKWYFTKNRQIPYPALPYGDYTLKIAATTSEKAENLQFLKIPIHIKTPFWKQGWVIMATILFSLVLIYLFFKYRILSYNRHIIRELLRLLIKKIKPKEKYYSFKDGGKEIRIKTDSILYVKSSGNYIEIVTEDKNYTVRTKIGEFIKSTPDPLEYLRIHRSYIVRIDKVAEKNSKEIMINKEKLPVSSSYTSELSNLIF